MRKINVLFYYIFWGWGIQIYKWGLKSNKSPNYYNHIEKQENIKTKTTQKREKQVFRFMQYVRSICHSIHTPLLLSFVWACKSVCIETYTLWFTPFFSFIWDLEAVCSKPKALCRTMLLLFTPTLFYGLYSLVLNM